MGLFSGLFGAFSPSDPAEPLAFEIQQGWFLDDADLKELSEILSNHPSLKVMQSHDAMDDYNVLTLSLAASQMECADFDKLPTLIFRARKKGLTIILEAYIHFKEKFFASRGSNPTVRLRFDNEEVITCNENDLSYSTDKSSLFFEHLGPFQKSLIVDQLRIQILPERGQPALATFDVAPARPVFESFAEAICGSEFQLIMAVNSQIVDFVLRLGPKNMLIYKKALAALRFDPGPLDYTKKAAFYKAVQSYAVARHASEIYGFLEGGSIKANTPWAIMLSEEMPSRLRQEFDTLKIFD
jgi:hypothetical protein